MTTVADYADDHYLFENDSSEIVQLTVQDDMGDLVAYVDFDSYGEFFYNHYRDALEKLDVVHVVNYEDILLWSNLAMFDEEIEDIIEEEMGMSLHDLGIFQLRVYASYNDNEIPGFTFAFELYSHMLSFPIDKLEEHMWPLRAAITNILDPGTFGSPFLFTSLVDKD